jgi:hypothetical protein
MEGEVYDCAVEHTLEQTFSYRDFASEKKTDEIGRPVTCLTNVVKESKDLVMTFIQFLVQNSSLAVWLLEFFVIILLA